MNLNHYLNSLGGEPLALGVMAVAGLVIIAFGAYGLRVFWKAGERGAGFLVPVLCTFFGLATVCVSGAVFFWHRPELPDDFADPTKMEALKGARLDAADAPKAAVNWPQWRGSHRDGIARETGLRFDWQAKPPQQLWKQTIGSGHSSLAVVDGRIYLMDKIGDEERVVCRDAGSGKELWVHRYAVDYSPFNRGFTTGPRATPTVHDGRVYTVGATGVFLCLDAAAEGQARVHWQLDLMKEFGAGLPEWGVACSPLIEDNLVIVQPGGFLGSIVAFDRRSGEVVWKALAERSGYSSPVAATIAGVRQIICLTGLGLVGLRASDGAQLWYFKWAPQFHANIATPLVAGDYVFVSAGYGAGCALVQVIGEESGFRAEPVYIKRNRLMRNHHSTCVLHDGHLYGFDDAVLKCIDLRTGEEKWYTREVAKGCLLLAEGHLLILSEDGRLTCAEASPIGFKKKGEKQVVEGSEVWALPALAGGRLYVRDNDELVCLELKR